MARRALRPRRDRSSSTTHSNERLVTDDLDDLLERLTPVAERLDCEAELRTVADIPAAGRPTSGSGPSPATGGDLVAVVDSVVAELAHSLES